MIERSVATGASGFVGSHLMDKLRSADTIPHTQIQSTDFGKYKNIYFLSTYGNMADHDDSHAIVNANVSDLVHVLQTADLGRMDSMVFVSTSSVRLPVQTMYSRTKKAAEEILLGYMEKYNAPIAIVRPYSITGVGEQPKHLIPTLIRSCLDGEPMDFVPDPVHDFIDVDDFVDGLLFVSERGTKGIYEIGSGEAYSNELVKEMVEEATGKKANVNVVRALRAYDTGEWVMRNTRMRDMGWMPKKTLQQSIKEMVEEYRERTRI